MDTNAPVSENPLCDSCPFLRCKKEEIYYDLLREKRARGKLKILRGNHPFTSLPCYTNTIRNKMLNNEDNFWSQLGVYREKLREVYAKWVEGGLDTIKLIMEIEKILCRIADLFSFSQIENFSGCELVNRLYFPYGYPSVPLELLQENPPPKLVSLYTRVLAGYLAMLSFSKKSVKNHIWPTQTKLPNDPYIGESICNLEQYIHSENFRTKTCCSYVSETEEAALPFMIMLTGNRTLTKALALNVFKYSETREGCSFLFVFHNSDYMLQVQDDYMKKQDYMLVVSTPKFFSANWFVKMEQRLRKRYPRVDYPVKAIIICKDEAMLLKLQSRIAKFNRKYDGIPFKALVLGNSPEPKALYSHLKNVFGEGIISRYVEEDKKLHSWINPNKSGYVAMTVSDMMSKEISRLLSPDFLHITSLLEMENNLRKIFDFTTFSKRVLQVLKDICGINLADSRLPEHYLFPSSAIRGTIHTKRWYTPPSKVNNHASKNAATLFVLRMAVIDLHITGATHTEDELRKEIGKMRVYINYQLNTMQSKPRKINKTGLARLMRYNSIDDLFIEHLNKHARQFWMPIEEKKMPAP